MMKRGWNPSTTRSARGCEPCLRYVLLPMCPGRTPPLLPAAVARGKESLTHSARSVGLGIAAVVWMPESLFHDRRHGEIEIDALPRGRRNKACGIQCGYLRARIDIW